MDIQGVLDLYAKSPQSAALARMFSDDKVRLGHVDGSVSSAVPVLFASVAGSVGRPCLFVLDDAEEAGYFYHDLTQMLGNRNVLFFPSYSIFSRLSSVGNTDLDLVTLRSWRLKPSMALVV